MRRLIWMVLAAACGSQLQAAAAADGMTVRLEHGSAREQAAQAQLQRLTAAYDLAPWIQTREIVIDEEAIPHSHPVLTLHTRHRNDDGLQVSTFIHEQSHWWLSRHPRETQAALRELKALYPALPVGYPDGADSLDASYEHLLVNCIELDAVREVLGAAEEQRISAFWQGDHYRTLYRIVAQDREKIRRILEKNQLQVPGQGR